MFKKSMLACLTLAVATVALTGCSDGGGSASPTAPTGPTQSPAVPATDHDLYPAEMFDSNADRDKIVKSEWVHMRSEGDKFPWTKNLVVNPGADQGTDGWLVNGQARRESVNGENVFTLGGYDNLLQEVVLSKRNRVSYVRIECKVWAPIVSPSNPWHGQPYMGGLLKDYGHQLVGFIDDLEEPTLYYTGPGQEWGKMSRIIEISPEIGRIFLGLHMNPSSPEIRALFDDIQIRVFKTRQEAEAFDSSSN